MSEEGRARDPRQALAAYRQAQVDMLVSNQGTADLLFDLFDGQSGELVVPGASCGDDERVKYRVELPSITRTIEVKGEHRYEFSDCYIAYSAAGPVPEESSADFYRDREAIERAVFEQVRQLTSRITGPSSGRDEIS